jgi:hypothetical protein
METPFNKLVTYLNKTKQFKTVYKRSLKYKRTFSHEDDTPMTYYIHFGKTIAIETEIDGVRETVNKCRSGDFILTGPLREKYVVLPKDIPKMYNIIDEKLCTRQFSRMVAKVPHSAFDALGMKDPITFTASWGEEMILHPGDYLMRDNNGAYYRIESTAFNMTYRFGKPKDAKRL